MKSIHAEYRSAVEALYCERESEIRAWLQRRFPRTCASLVGDAVADAFTDALAHDSTFFSAWRKGPAALIRCVRKAAWRRLRGHLRKHSTRCEIPTQRCSEPEDTRTPESLCAARETLQHVALLIDEAAARYGGRHGHSLRAALVARFAGSTDAEVARAHRLPREYVNRAKRWIMSELRSR